MLVRTTPSRAHSKLHRFGSLQQSLALGLLAATGTVSLLAQTADDSENAFELAPQVVTASSRSMLIEDAPASISVVSNEDLEMRPIQDITQALGLVEGVTVSRSGNQRKLQLRGLSSAYTLIMIDGKRVNSESAMFRGNDYDASWVPIEAIQRIEVVRGPMSSLYGSDAIGGVINVITKPVGSTWSGSLSADYVFQEERDAGDSYKAGFFVSGPIIDNTLGVKVWGGYDHREADDDTLNPSGLEGMPEQDEKFVNGTMDWTPSEDTRISGQYGFSRQTHDDFTMERQDYMVTAEHFFDFGDGRLRFFGDKIENLDGSTTGETNPNEANNWTTDARMVLPWDAARQTFSFGGEFRHQELEDAALLAGWPGAPDYGVDPTTQVDQYAFFVEDEISLLEDLTLTVGDRFDDHENFGGHHSPRAYLIYKPIEKLSFRAGWAEAFRAPTLLQNSPNWGSVSCGSATEGCYIIGSEDLEPEESTSYEFGVRYDDVRWAASITYFHNELENMIDISSRTRDPDLAPSYPNFVGFLEDGRPIFSYQNIARVESEGVEVSVNGDITDTVGLRVSYTYLDSQNLSYEDAIPLIYQPEHSGSVTLDWRPTDVLSFYTTAEYIGEQYIQASTRGTATQSAYTLFDVGLRYKVSESFTCRTGILNIGDKRIERTESSEYNEDGRRYFVSATYHF
ncbi:MAG: iron complex outermembrane recepter protein [Puniceicoccaceae bacterium 5H]|nr:MAG: iron complex outermembrane recepter protein [Puniceicoccaceae bacterium 5H]